MHIALIHDWILGLGGAERVLKVLHEMFPEAPIYTFFYNKKFTDKFLPRAEIKSSFLQKLYKLRLNHKLFLPFLPTAAESFDLSGFDLVISSSIAFSKGLILKPKTRHICYCYSPTRFLWDWHKEYQTQNAKHKTQNFGIGILQHFLRIWDRSAADRVDEFIAISKNVQQRIKKYYNRDSTVIYPPVSNWTAPQTLPLQYARSTSDSARSPSSADLVSSEKLYLIPTVQSASSATSEAMSVPLQKSLKIRSWKLERFDLDSAKRSDLEIEPNYFLIVSRLFPHKNIDIAIQAFNKLELPLTIVGNGPEKKHLQKLAAPNADIKFAGTVSDENLVKYYQECKAFVMPQEEDFGLTPLEAMQFGKPVLALKKGGALEYILEGINGEFFEDAHPAVLADGIRRLNENYRNYSPLVIKKTAEKFSRQRFEEEIKKTI